MNVDVQTEKNLGHQRAQLNYTGQVNHSSSLLSPICKKGRVIFTEER